MLRTTLHQEFGLILDTLFEVSAQTITSLVYSNNYRHRKAIKVIVDSKDMTVYIFVFIMLVTHQKDYQAHKWHFINTHWK